MTPTLTLLLTLLACAPADLEDPTFFVEQVPEWVLLRDLGSARIDAQDAEPLGEQVGFLEPGRVSALDWDSAQVQVALTHQGLLWTVWLDRQDLSSAVTQERFVEVGELGAGVRFPAGMMLQAQEVLGGWQLSHDEGLEPIFAPGQVVDQVFERGLVVRSHEVGGWGLDMVALPGAVLRDGPAGSVFASLQSPEQTWVTPLEARAGGWWVIWTAPFGEVEGWLADAELEHRPMEGGGWSGGGWGCGGVAQYGYGHGYSPASVVLEPGTLLVDAPGGRAFGRVEQARSAVPGEPVAGWYPVLLPTPWGEQELWVQLDGLDGLER